MDSMRPDDDELRADAPIAGEVRKSAKKKPGADEPRSSGGGAGSGPPMKKGNDKGAGGASGGLVWTLLVLLVVVIAGGGWFGLQLYQQVGSMKEQLEEADYGARQSKLALARFEGELSETGESLEETGSTLDQRLSSLDSQLKEANDEIRKLWVLSNEKNRPQITALKETQDSLSGQLDTLSSDMEATGQNVVRLQATTESLDSGLSQVRQAHQESRERLQVVTSDLEGTTGRLDGMENQVNQRLQRFQQEQSLTLDGLESRVEALENGGGNLDELSGQLASTRSRLQKAEETLEAVDASRSQLTSRLLRLQDQVDQLRSQ